MDAHTILVIDDDEELRQTFIEVLRDQGYGAIGAVNGADALDQLRSSPETPCLILLDLMMPVMDGREFRARQLRDPALAKIPVVVVSAIREPPQVTPVSADAHLDKPVDMVALLSTVRRICRFAIAVGGAGRAGGGD